MNALAERKKDIGEGRDIRDMSSAISALEHFLLKNV